MEKSVFNSEQVRNTLDFLIPILEEIKIEYRVLGSVVTAAINSGLHRKLGDIDLVIDIKKRDALRQKLYKRGYHDKGGIFKLGRKYLSLDTMEHDSLLEIGLFAGKFREDGSFIIGNENKNITVDAHAMKPYKYHLLNYVFNGLPPVIVAAGINTTKRNPKRERETEILKEKGIIAAPNNYVHTKVFSVKADWSYHAFTGILNTIGVLRVALGKPYDPWR